MRTGLAIALANNHLLALTSPTATRPKLTQYNLDKYMKIMLRQHCYLLLSKSDWGK